MLEITTTDSIYISTINFYSLIDNISDAWGYGNDIINIPLSNGTYTNINISQITNIKILL